MAVDRVSADDPLVITWVLGGASAANEPWVHATEALDREASSLGRGSVSPLRVNLSVFIPGPIYQAPFSGVRTGKYDPRLNLLLVQGAVIDLHDPSPRLSLLALLGSGLDAAERWAVRRHLEVDGLQTLRSLARQLAEVG